MAFVMAFSVMAGFGIFYADTRPTLDFTPDKAVEFHDMNKFLFREKEFTTKLSSQPPYASEDWRNFYWCDFVPQYSADYSFDVKSQFKMKCEIYDAENNLLSSGYSADTKESDKLYHFSLTYRLEIDKQYYFKFAFTEGNYDTVGKFYVYFSSGESGTLSDDPDRLNLTINGSSASYTYELAEYSVPQLMQDLQLVVFYPKGKYSIWKSSDTPITALDGVDIIFNASDCAATVGRHTLVAHYLGYEVKASFNIIKCKHSYKIKSIDEPAWKETGAVNYECEKCGETYSDIIPTAEELKPLIEASLNAKKGESNYNVNADINRDNVINARDISIVLRAYEEYNPNPSTKKGEGISQSFAEQP